MICFTFVQWSIVIDLDEAAFLLFNPPVCMSTTSPNFALSLPLESFSISQYDVNCNRVTAKTGYSRSSSGCCVKTKQC